MRALRVSIAAVAVLLGAARLSSAQLIVGNDQTTSPTIWLINVGGGPNQALLTGTQATTWAMAADDPNKILYWNNAGTLMRSPYGATLTPTSVAITIGGAAANVTGMAYDTSANVLYGYRSVTAPGFYVMDPITGISTLAAATPASTDFGGFDYDPVTNAFYALNDSTGLSGRGLYKITGIAGGTPTYTLLTPYPGTDTDVDGLAVGNGRAYMVNDNSTAGQGIYVYNLTTNAYETPIANPFSGTNGIFSGGAWAPSIVPEPSSLALVAAVSLIALRRKQRN